jgi:hypothetical protein
VLIDRRFPPGQKDTKNGRKEKERGKKGRKEGSDEEVWAKERYLRVDEETQRMSQPKCCYFHHAFLDRKPFCFL